MYNDDEMKGGAALDISALWQSFLATPVANYLALILLFILVCMLVGGILRGLLRFVFRSIKFVVCLVLAIVLLAFLMGKFAYQPSVHPPQKVEALTTFNLAVEQFKGIYAPKLPLIAWRFSDAPSNEVVVRAANDESAPTESPEDPCIRVEYLPFGEILLRYNQDNGEFSVVKKLNEGKNSRLINTIFRSAAKLLPQ